MYMYNTDTTASISTSSVLSTHKPPAPSIINNGHLSVYHPLPRLLEHPQCRSQVNTLIVIILAHHIDIAM